MAQQFNGRNVFQKFDGQKATLYFNNDFGFGIGSMEVRLYETGTRTYAQYDGAGYVSYKKKGARTVRGMVFTYKPWMVALEGWGLPKFDNWRAPQKNGEVVTQRGKYSSCDERWEQMGDLFVADVQGQTGAKLLADFRYTKGFNPHDRFTPVAVQS